MWLRAGPAARSEDMTTAAFRRRRVHHSRHLLVVGLTLVVGTTACGAGDDDDVAAPPSATSTVTSEETTSPDVTPRPFIESDDPVAIEAGMYEIPRSGWSRHDYTVTFPEGWTVQYGHVYLKHPETDDELGFYAVLPDTTIYADACEGSEGDLLEVGPGVDDLVAALLRQRGPTATEPVETTLGGYPATRIDLSGPEGFDLRDCNLQGIGFQVWFSHPADKYFVLVPEVTMSVYIVDVVGQRQVFLANASTGSNADDRELQAILDSIRIEA